MTGTEDLDPAEADKYISPRFWWGLFELLQERYFVAAKAGKIKTLGDANKWPSKQERVEARHVAAKRWRAIKLQ